MSEQQNNEELIMQAIADNANASESEFTEVGADIPDLEDQPAEDSYEDHREDQEDVEDPTLEMDGELAVELVDIAVSRIGALGFTLAKIPAHFQDFQLTAEEKRTLAPLIEKWLEYEQFTLNPRYALLGTAAMIYGIKGVGVYQRYKQAQEDGTEEDLEQKATKNKGGRPKGSKDKKPRKKRSDAKDTKSKESK